jgi:ribose transport system ATP-binding protein
VSTPPLLAIRGVAKAFAVPVLDAVDLDVRAGEVHALVGENGAGKSTLARILAGLLPPDAGRLALEGAPWRPTSRLDAERAGVCLVLQELNVVPTWSVAENVWLGRPFPQRLGFVRRDELEAGSRAALARVGLGDSDVWRPIGGLGVGQQQLVEIARGLSRHVRLLVLDEPTASLAPREVDLLVREVRALTSAGAAVLYISHRLDEVLGIADRVSVLRDGRLVATQSARETSPAALIQLMVGRDLDSASAPVAPKVGEPVLRVDGLMRRPVLHDVGFEVRAGEIVGLAGLMGSGRTETLRCLFGADRADGGRVMLQGRESTAPLRSPWEAAALGIGLLPEDRRRQGLIPAMAVAPNLTLTRLGPLTRRLGWIDTERERRDANTLVAQLDVRCRSVDQPVAELSGGNQQKIAFGRWLFRGCRVLLCDEPTRGIDVAARAAIHERLRDMATGGVAIVVASSDLPEVIALSHRVVVLSGGRVARVLARGVATEATIAEAAFASHRRPA